MRRLVVTISFLVLSCGKGKTPDPQQEEAKLWPLKKGNMWVFKAITGNATGASKDTAGISLEADSVTYIKGDEYFSLKGDYSKWYRSAKGEVLEADGQGSAVQSIARNVAEQKVIWQQSGTFSYFTGPQFTGYLTRIANPEITVIKSYNCVKMEDLYKDETGVIVQKKVVYYSANTGPVSIAYYGNRESPGSGDIYLMLQYTLDNLVLN